MSMDTFPHHIPLARTPTAVLIAATDISHLSCEGGTPRSWDQGGLVVPLAGSCTEVGRGIGRRPIAINPPKDQWKARGLLWSVPRKGMRLGPMPKECDPLVGPR